MDDQRERDKERAILKANPVLGTDKFKSDLERWTHFSDLAAQKFEDPLSKEAANWIARKIEESTNQ